MLRFICLSSLSSEHSMGTSKNSYSSLGEDITEPQRVFNLSALSLVVDIPLAISLVIFLLPIFIASQKINFSFSNTDIDEDESPKSTQIHPKSLSSKLRVAKAEDSGVGIKLAICIFKLLNKLVYVLIILL